MSLRDSVFVQNIETYTNPDDYLDLFPTYYQTLFVTGEMTLRTPVISTIGELVTKEHVSLIEIHSSKNSDVMMLTLKRPRDTTDFPTTGLEISKLDSFKSSASEGGRFSIQAVEFYNLPNSDDLKTYEWSKELGYLGFELDNGEVWRLTKFLRDNRNLLTE